MSFVLLSVICSVLVSVLLKLTRAWHIDVGQAVAWNYVVAGALAAALLRPPLGSLRAPGVPWLALLALGVLLPTIFLALAAAVRHAGIVRSDAAQRLSLVLSLLAAFLLFGEELTLATAAGMAMGLVALLCMVWRAGGSAPGVGAAAWSYPLLVFAGFGTIDILLKRVAAAGVPLGASLLGMFTLAMLVAFAMQGWRAARSGMRFTWRSAGGGLLLGLLNFGNILFYLRGHQALPQRPALVFTSMNIGVVALSAVVGLLLFRERLSALNLAGVALVVPAIALLAAS